jgi:3-keto-L-gulonate-6-phosphate decarboxylase
LKGLNVFPYIVADLKCMDRGESEVQIAKDGGASAAVVLGQAPIETINSFVGACASSGLDSMVDMMNIDQPIKILRRLRKPPTVVVLHRGVDEERFSKDKPIPYIQINKVRSSYNVMIAIAGGDTIREVERAIFNDADIVVVWKEFYKPGAATGQLAQDFLKKIR